MHNAYTILVGYLVMLLSLGPISYRLYDIVYDNVYISA